MSDRTPGDLQDDASHSTDEYAKLLSRYLDHLNSGELVDPDQILADHPEQGPRLVSALEAFLDLQTDQTTEQSLGTLGDYTLRREIGRGGMGVVYEAWENSMDRRVALKVLPAGIAADAKACTRFMREAQTAGKLNHPNVVGDQLLRASLRRERTAEGE